MFGYSRVFTLKKQLSYYKSKEIYVKEGRKVYSAPPVPKVVVADD